MIMRFVGQGVGHCQNSVPCGIASDELESVDKFEEEEEDEEQRNVQSTESRMDCDMRDSDDGEAEDGEEDEDESSNGEDDDDEEGVVDELDL
jgi:hypothetical protein